MPDYLLQVNGARRRVTVSAGTPLLWVLRDALGLTGAKYGCGAGLCGACTLHLGGEAVRSCSVPVEQAAAKPIVTIEGSPSSRAECRRWAEPPLRSFVAARPIVRSCFARWRGLKPPRRQLLAQLDSLHPARLRRRVVYPETHDAPWLLRRNRLLEVGRGPHLGVLDAEDDVRPAVVGLPQLAVRRPARLHVSHQRTALVGLEAELLNVIVVQRRHGDPQLAQIGRASCR